MVMNLSMKRFVLFLNEYNTVYEILKKMTSFLKNVKVRMMLQYVCFISIQYGVRIFEQAFYLSPREKK